MLGNIIGEDEEDIIMLQKESKGTLEKFVMYVSLYSLFNKSTDIYCLSCCESNL